MLKKLLKLNKKNLIILMIVAVIVSLLLSTLVVNIVKDVIGRYAKQNDMVTYDVIDINKNSVQLLLKLYDENGLKKVIVDGYEIECKYRTTIALDRNWEDRTNHTIVVTNNNGTTKTENLFFEIPRAKGNYELNNGGYIQEPYVDKGFEKGTTRYLALDNGHLVPGNWISGEKPSNWYNYNESQWANIFVESNGREVYYVWIPRYCYKLDESATERVDIKFINIENEYKYLENGEEKILTWDSLQEQGYQIPHAFWWDKDNDGVEDVGEQITGYWAMKYEIAEGEVTTTVNFDVSVRRGFASIKNIQANSTITDNNPITKYTIAINGTIVKEINDITTINYNELNFSGIIDGMNYINVTGLNANGEIVGSMTKNYEYNTNVEMNEPNLLGFNRETTYYVTYDEEGNENSTIPITQEPPENWYNYTDGVWANIVTRNNDAEIYYVWIPRYQYKIDANERTTIKFIKGTSTEVQSGYEIPDAFWWDKNNDGIRDNDEQLTGFWAMKYEVANIE